MTEPTFPPELVRRCAKAAYEDDPIVLGMMESNEIEETVTVILRESGHAELVAALKPFALVASLDIGVTETDEDQFMPSQWNYNRAAKLTVGDLRRAVAALKKAGAS